MKDLRRFLSGGAKGRPSKIRVRMADGEERDLAVPHGGGSAGWKTVTEAVQGSGGVYVECVDKDGKILRGMPLDDTDEDDLAKEDKRTSQAMAGQAQMLDRYGHRMNQAFHAGAAAAAVSQDKLVDLVEVLTGHLSLAITNLHTVSVNLANLVQQQADPEGGSPGSKMVESMLTGMAARMIEGGGRIESPNGKPRAK